MHIAWEHPVIVNFTAFDSGMRSKKMGAKISV
jgi:hypothetical protein